MLCNKILSVGYIKNVDKYDNHRNFSYSAEKDKRNILKITKIHVYNSQSPNIYFDELIFLISNDFQIIA